MITPGTIAAQTDTSADHFASSEKNTICTYLDWDSEFFGKRVARLNRSRLVPSSLSEVLAWCAGHRIDCLYFLADADDAETRRLAEQDNFLEVDVRLTLARPITQENLAPELSMDSRVRLARESDLPALRRFARILHRDSRFYFDHQFERAKCDLLYETWVENSFHDAAQTVFVAEVDDQPAGYAACRLHGEESQIGLLGVAEAHTRRGLGKALVGKFLSWSALQGSTRATVVTQARNSAARGLYQGAEFLPSSSQRWYHRWFTNR